MHPLAADRATTEAAWRALDSGVVLLDRSERLRMRFSGPKAAESLNGLVTNDVVSLAPGAGQYAAALTAKGKILADLRIFRRDDDLLVDVPPAAAEAWSAMIRKFVNPRLAKYEDVSSATGTLGAYGAGAAVALESALGAEGLAALPQYGHFATSDGLLVARVPDFGVDGFDLIGTRQALDARQARLVAAGAVADPGEALRIRRIEAGRPEFGEDMDETMLAQEADLERLQAISFSKGCYTGQETVARVHFRGHVNRHLRGLQFAAGSPAPAGTELQDASGKAIGVTKGGAVSPRFGAIALALVRREIEPGQVIRAAAAECTVRALPFEP